jgi:hypothetical protein
MKYPKLMFLAAFAILASEPSSSQTSDAMMRDLSAQIGEGRSVIVGQGGRLIEYRLSSEEAQKAKPFDASSVAPGKIIFKRGGVLYEVPDPTSGTGGTGPRAR